MFRSSATVCGSEFQKATRSHFRTEFMSQFDRIQYSELASYRVTDRNVGFSCKQRLYKSYKSRRTVSVNVLLLNGPRLLYILYCNIVFFILSTVFCLLTRLMFSCLLRICNKDRLDVVTDRRWIGKYGVVKLHCIDVV